MGKEERKKERRRRRSPTKVVRTRIVEIRIKIHTHTRGENLLSVVSLFTSFYLFLFYNAGQRLENKRRCCNMLAPLIRLLLLLLLYFSLSNVPYSSLGFVGWSAKKEIQSGGAAFSTDRGAMRCIAVHSPLSLSPLIPSSISVPE